MPKNPLPYISRPLRLVVLLILSTISLATAFAQGFGPAGPSPVTGHASVVATGSADVTEESGRWHVTRYTAESGTEQYLSTTQGYVIAENTPLMVILDSGHRTRLGRPGGAGPPQPVDRAST